MRHCLSATLVLQLWGDQHREHQPCYDLEMVSAGLSSGVLFMLCAWAWQILASEVRLVERHCDLI